MANLSTRQEHLRNTMRQRPEIKQAEPLLKKSELALVKTGNGRLPKTDSGGWLAIRLRNLSGSRRKGRRALFFKFRLESLFQAPAVIEGFSDQLP